MPTLTTAATDGRPLRESGMDKCLNLSDREKAVLRGILDDKTYPQIAHSMKLSLETIKSYTARLRAKLGINTKTGLAVWASKNLNN